MRAVTLWIAFAFLITACAHHHYEDDKHDPNYQQGLYAPLIGAPADLNPVIYAPGTGVAALILAGATLAANPDYYRKIAITGHCRYHAGPADSLDQPCRNVDIVLRDQQGHELSRAQVDGGEFAFRVAGGTLYHLDAVAPKWKLEPEAARREYRLGDDVVLRLIRR